MKAYAIRTLWSVPTSLYIVHSSGLMLRACRLSRRSFYVDSYVEFPHAPEFS